MKRILRYAFATTLVAILCGGGPRAGEEKPPGEAIPRFRQVLPGLYRGGQPTPEGFDFLQKKGIKTVINLREEQDEKDLVDQLGMKYVYLPLNSWHHIPKESVKTFLIVVTDPANHPVFVHCQRGADRTGFMIGVYRIAQQGWSAEQAYREARGIGMRWWYRGLKRQLFDFADTQTLLQPATAGK